MSTNGFFTNVTKEGSQAAFGKFGFEGPPGSGKTTTAALLAVGISKEYHNGAPVVWVDSENGANFIRPIFVAEKVDLLVVPTRALSTLIKAVDEATRAGACTLVPDSMTKFWTTLVANYMKEHSISNYKYMLSHWPAVKDPWRVWADLFINCPLHTIACGRGGFEYDQVDVIDDEGNVNTETVKGDYKMKGEGEFGHEPDVNLHFQAMTDPNTSSNIKQKKGKKGKIVLAAPRKIHVATVQKGRVWQLNGKVYQWPDRDTYKAGEYTQVLDHFRPYLDALNIGGKHQSVAAGDNPFKRGDTNGGYIRKQKILESFKTTMDMIFTERTVLAKKQRLYVGEQITDGIRSAKEFAMQDVDALDFQYQILKKFEQRTKQEGLPETEEGLRKLTDLARLEAQEDWRLLHPAATSTPEQQVSEGADGPF